MKDVLLCPRARAVDSNCNNGEGSKMKREWMGGIAHKFSLITFIASFLFEEIINLQNEII